MYLRALELADLELVARPRSRLKKLVDAVASGGCPTDRAELTHDEWQNPRLGRASVLLATFVALPRLLQLCCGPYLLRLHLTHDIPLLVVEVLRTGGEV